ncbi:unnamed protein product, partial [Arabidopsis halleri]
YTLFDYEPISSVVTEQNESFCGKCMFQCSLVFHSDKLSRI